jgi:hypothetical protein
VIRGIPGTFLFRKPDIQAACKPDIPGLPSPHFACQLRAWERTPAVAFAP